MYNAASPLHTDLQVVNIQRCERAFACPITCLVYTLMCTHRLQAAVLCILYPIVLCGVGFPHSSVGKESACNAGDPSSIPEWGRSAAEGIGYPLQHPWASLVAQVVKNPPATWETAVRSLGWEDSLEKG